MVNRIQGILFVLLCLATVRSGATAKATIPTQNQNSSQQNTPCDCADAQTTIKAELLHLFEKNDEKSIDSGEVLSLLKRLNILTDECRTKFPEATDLSDCKNQKKHEEIEAEFALILRVLNMYSEGIYCD